MTRRQEQEFIEQTYDKIIAYASTYASAENKYGIRRLWRKSIRSLRPLIRETDYKESIEYFECVTNHNFYAED